MSEPSTIPRGTCHRVGDRERDRRAGVSVVGRRDGDDALQGVTPNVKTVVER
jgi:hypothetical protein